MSVFSHVQRLFGRDSKAKMKRRPSLAPDASKEEMCRRVQTLGPREKEAYQLLRAGHSTLQTAEAMGVPLSNVRMWERHIHRQLGVQDAETLVRRYGPQDCPTHNDNQPDEPGNT